MRGYFSRFSKIALLHCDNLQRDFETTTIRDPVTNASNIRSKHKQIEDPFCIDLSTNTSDLVPGTIINALVYYNFENQPVLSLRNSRLINHKQINLYGHTSYLLGIHNTKHPFILDSLRIHKITEFLGIEQSSYLSFSFPKTCELVPDRQEKFKNLQNKTWAAEKLEKAKKLIGIKNAKASKLITDSIILDPNNAQGYLLQGKLHFSIQKFEEAKRDFLTVLEILPNNHKAQKMIQKISQKTKNFSYEIKDKRLYNSGHEDKLIYSSKNS